MELTKFERQVAMETFNAQAAVLTTTAMLAACSAVKDMLLAAQLFSVTMEEAGEIQIAYHADRSPESIEAWQRYINSVLSRRHAAQKAPAPSAQEIKLVERDAAYYKERYNATLERESQLLEQLATAEPVSLQRRSWKSAKV